MSQKTGYYTECETRLNKFYYSLSETNALFIFYRTFDETLTLPQIPIAKFRKWEFKASEYFVMKGLHDNYIYVYEKQGLAVLIKVEDEENAPKAYIGNAIYNTASHAKSKRIMKEVQIVGSNNNKDYVREAHIGNHIDFSFARATTDLLFKTHYTSYNDWGEQSSFRSARYCNFLQSDVKNGGFGETICYEGRNKPNGLTVSTCYTDHSQLHAVEGLFKIVTGEYQKKKYIARQKFGGMTNLVVYEGIAVNNDVFAFVVENIVKKVWRERPDEIHGVQLFYDSSNELNANGAFYIVLIYMFADGGVRKFCLDTKTILAAYYAETIDEEMRDSFENAALVTIRNFSLESQQLVIVHA